MADSLIKSVSQPPAVQDALKKPEKEKQSKPERAKKRPVKKDSKHIIDTYA